jgi:signal transduction histidine kinase
MLVAIAVVTGIAWWDEQREADSALRDLETEQSILAASLAGSLRAHLTTTGRDVRPEDLFERDPRLVRPGELVVFVVPPNDPTLHGMDGRTLSSVPLREALDRGASTVRLSRPEAAAIGLPARTSMAGLALVDVGDLGRWGVVAVASAARERDREKRAMSRLVLGVVLASGLVLAFGGAALRRQRKELELARELAVAEVQRDRDEQLQRSGRVATMGTFAMGIAHEVATPLGVIVGRAEQLLGRVQNDERATRGAQTILQQADRIQHIVRRFLDMARGGPPSLERADPTTVVRAATHAVEHRFAKARVTLSADVPTSMPAIQCDRDLLEQAIVNLLLNACEACGPGGRVEVTARSDADQVAVVVTDDGVGISQENALRATEPFFTTKHDVNGAVGTGLGLAIATEIVKSHRGELTIAPGAGKGTRACIEIPIARASER